MVKNGYCRNDGFIFAWDLGVIFFRHTKFGDWPVFKTLFFNFSFQGVMKKVLVVSLCTYFKGFLIKNGGYTWYLENTFITHRYPFLMCLMVKKGYMRENSAGWQQNTLLLCSSFLWPGFFAVVVKHDLAPLHGGFDRIFNENFLVLQRRYFIEHLNRAAQKYLKRQVVDLCLLSVTLSSKLNLVNLAVKNYQIV